MTIEILPAKDLKKPAEIPVDFTTLIQKAIKFDIRKQKKGKKYILPLIWFVFAIDELDHYASI